jgi:hypothetical protein
MRPHCQSPASAVKGLTIGRHAPRSLQAHLIRCYQSIKIIRFREGPDIFIVVAYPVIRVREPYDVSV